MSTDDYNKGYFSSDISTPEGRYGNAARERERAERANSSSSQYGSTNWLGSSNSSSFYDAGSSVDRSTGSSYPSISWSSAGSHPSSAAPSRPATLGGSIKGMAVLGLIVAVAYALVDLHITSWEGITVWGLQGAIIGAIAGAGLYVAIVVLRFVLSAIAVILTLAVWASLIVGGLYLLSKFL